MSLRTRSPRAVKPTVKPTVKTPPVAKAKPKPKVKAIPVVACSRISVAQKTLEGSGDPQTILASVKQGSKGVGGARIVLTGPGIQVLSTTDAGGNARITLKPTKAGIVKLAIGNKKACNSSAAPNVSVRDFDFPHSCEHDEQQQ